jgi:hypothetical protein
LDQSVIGLGIDATVKMVSIFDLAYGILATFYKTTYTQQQPVYALMPKARRRTQAADSRGNLEVITT